MKQGSKIGIVCCSNGLRPEQAETIKMLVQILEKSGLEVDLSPYLYGDENGQAGTARERAGALMKFYEDDFVTDIFHYNHFLCFSQGTKERNTKISLVYFEQMY